MNDNEITQEFLDAVTADPRLDELIEQDVADDEAWRSMLEEHRDNQIFAEINNAEATTSD